MNERQLQDAILEMAGALGWRRAHFRPARVMRGGREIYETPIDGDGKGFPDLILLRGDRLIVAELKSEAGSVAEEQEAWLGAFREAGALVAVWRPRDWISGVIEGELRRKSNADRRRVAA